MPLPFNKTLDLKLLKLVKDHSMLYNTTHPKYMDFDAREVIWQKIGDILSRPGSVCKSRWINMRDMMRRKVNERLRNPNRLCKYKYEDELSFMLPYFKDSASSREEYAEYNEEEQTEIEIPSEVYVEEDYDHLEQKEMKYNVFRKKNQEDSREFNEPLYQELNSTDPIDVFLITIGTTLRKFSPYYLNQAKSKIFSVVQDYELKQIVDKNEHPAGSSDNRSFGD